MKKLITLIFMILIICTLAVSTISAKNMDDPLTRGDLCQILYDFFRLDVNIDDIDTNFSDLTPDHKNYEACMFFIDCKFLLGYDTGLFNPDGSMSNAELATLLTIFTGVKIVSNYEGEISANPSSWYYNYAATACYYGLMEDCHWNDKATVGSINYNNLLKIVGDKYSSISNPFKFSKGDINTDKKINTNDFILISKLLAGWEVYVDYLTIDCNDDGDVDMNDAVLLMQYLAGWNVKLGTNNHIIETDEAVAPTCQSTGLTEGKHCSDCGLIIEKQKEIPKSDHDYEDTIYPPTETEKGYTLHKCKDCGYEFIDTYTGVTLAKGLEYSIKNDECTIVSIGACTETDITIPSTIENCNVTAIADNAFSGQTQITNMHLPKHIKYLGSKAFYGCTGLEEFTIPNSVIDVGADIFGECDNLATVYYNSNFSPDEDGVFLNISSIETIVFGGINIPNNICFNCNNIKTVEILDGAQIISNRAFYGCKKLNNLSIPNSVTSIGDYAFYGCRNIKEINLGNSIITIGDWAFYDCYSLPSVVIPNSIRQIGSSAFSHCRELNTVYYIGNSEEWESILIGDWNSTYFTGATRYYYSEVQPTEEGRYWHYVGGKPIPW